MGKRNKLLHIMLVLSLFIVGCEPIIYDCVTDDGVSFRESAFVTYNETLGNNSNIEEFNLIFNDYEAQQKLRSMNEWGFCELVIEE